VLWGLVISRIVTQSVRKMVSVPQLKRKGKGWSTDHAPLLGYMY